MIETAVTGVKLTLRYEKGSYSYSHLDPDAGDAALYEVADALNSLQSDPAQSIRKTAARRIIEV